MSDERTFSSPSAAFLHAAMISSYEASFCSLTVKSTTLTSTVGTCSSQESGMLGDHALTCGGASHRCLSFLQTVSLGICDVLTTDFTGWDTNSCFRIWLPDLWASYSCRC